MRSRARVRRPPTLAVALVLAQLIAVWNRFPVSPTSLRVVSYGIPSLQVLTMELAMLAVPYEYMSFLSHYTDADAARDLTLDAAQAARASGGTKRSLSTTQVKKLLDSRNDREVLEGLRRVMSVCNYTAPEQSWRCAQRRYDFIQNHRLKRYKGPD